MLFGAGTRCPSGNRSHVVEEATVRKRERESTACVPVDRLPLSTPPPPPQEHRPITPSYSSFCCQRSASSATTPALISLPNYWRKILCRLAGQRVCSIQYLVSLCLTRPSSAVVGRFTDPRGISTVILRYYPFISLRGHSWSSHFQFPPASSLSTDSNTTLPVRSAC